MNTVLSHQHKLLLERAMTAAKQAGACIMEFYGKDLAVWCKGIGSHSGDCVTQADYEAQRVIFEELFNDGFSKDPLLSNVAVLAEEMADYSQSKRFVKDYCFIIDPLDGTRGFLDHTNSFASSIGFIQQDGTPIFGVACLPAYNRIYVGVHNHRCEENGAPLTRVPLGDELVLLVSEAEIFAPDRNAIWHQLCNHIKKETSIKTIRPQVVGSPVHKGCYTIACGQAALYLGLPRPKRGVSLWDLAAITSIVTGAGGFASDAFGKRLDLNRRDSIYAHHKGFLFCSHPALAQVTLDALAGPLQNSNKTS